ncbi:MAG: hypothetical protein AAF570_07090 [Bacteroidota bacterium]
MKKYMYGLVLWAMGLVVGGEVSAQINVYEKTFKLGCPKPANYVMSVTEMGNGKFKFSVSKSELTEAEAALLNSGSDDDSPDPPESTNKYCAFELTHLKDGPFKLQFIHAIEKLTGEDVRDGNCEIPVREKGSELFIDAVKVIYTDQNSRGPVAGWVNVKPIVPLYQRKGTSFAPNKKICGNRRLDKTRRMFDQDEKRKIQEANYHYLDNPAYKNMKAYKDYACPGPEMPKDPELPDGLEGKDGESGNAALIVDSVQVEFRGSMIDNIVVTGHLREFPHQKLLFTNGMPFSFGTERDFDKLDRYYLFEDWHDEYVIWLPELLQYVQRLNTGRKDYSPMDTTMIFYPREGFKRVHKETTKKILEASVFSDFVGFSEDVPNGLVQTEVSKRINLHTRRRKLCCDPRRANFGYFSSIRPTLTVSKIEGKERLLKPGTLDTIQNGTLSRDRFVNTVDLLRYENLSAGFDQNLLLFEFQQLKMILYLNGGLRFGRTSIQDSLPMIENNAISDTRIENNFTVNTFRFFSEATMKFFPDERYNLELTWRTQPMFLLDNRIKTVGNVLTYAATGSDGFNEQTKAVIHTGEILGSARTGARGRLFFRYRLNFAHRNVNTNFHQAQVGYSFFLLAK